MDKSRWVGRLVLQAPSWKAHWLRSSPWACEVSWSSGGGWRTSRPAALPTSRPTDQPHYLLTLYLLATQPSRKPHSESVGCGTLAGSEAGESRPGLELEKAWVAMMRAR